MFVTHRNAILTLNFPKAACFLAVIKTYRERWQFILGWGRHVTNTIPRLLVLPQLGCWSLFFVWLSWQCGKGPSHQCGCHDFWVPGPDFWVIISLELYQVFLFTFTHFWIRLGSGAEQVFIQHQTKGPLTNAVCQAFWVPGYDFWVIRSLDLYQVFFFTFTHFWISLGSGVE